jgi:hypothetical protein
MNYIIIQASITIFQRVILILKEESYRHVAHTYNPAPSMLSHENNEFEPILVSCIVSKKSRTGDVAQW